MKRLSLHILSLLRLYGSAALPGFGYLSFKQFPASLSEDGTEFLPPYSQLVFRPSNSVEEEKLVQSYSRKERISMEEAVSMVEQDLDKLLTSLNEHGKAELPNLGTFINTDGGIDFVSEYPQSPVLPVLRIKNADELELEELLQEFATDDEEFDLIQFLEEDLKEEAPVAVPSENLHYHDPRYFYIPIHKTMAKIAASFLLVLAVGIVAFIPFGSHTKSSSTASIAPISVSEKVAARKAANKKIEKKTLADAQKERLAKAKKDSVENAPLKVDPLSFNDNEDNKYYAVVGAFKVQKQVDRFVESHPADKKAFKIIKKGSYYLITVSTATSQEEMDERLPLIRTEYPNVWVHKP